MTGATPKITVVIPTYNMAHYLPVAIDSALGQTMGDFELIVLDNASTDRTAGLLAGYHDPRLRYVRNPINLGLAGNVRRGCDLARGEYLTFLGADDRWLPAFLAEAASVLDRGPGMSMVHGPAAWIDSAGRRFGGTGAAWPPITPGGEAMVGVFGAGFCFATMVMRRDALLATGPMDEQWQEVIDLWMFLRMCLAGKVGYLPEIWCEYRVHAGAMSMPMYRDNLMFRRQLAAIGESFAWPEAEALGVARHRSTALRHIARTAVDVLHMSHAAGRGQLLRNLAEIAAVVPEVLIWPRTWARVGFGLLPGAAIRTLQGLRRRRSLASAASVQAAAP